MAKSVFSAPHFQDEAAAFAYVEAHLWPQGPFCPHCGATEPHVKRLNGKTTRLGLHKCYACKGHFTVRQGSIFESSHLALHLWLQVIHLMCASKKGVSSHQVQRMLRCSRKTAWFVCHRIREIMASEAIMGGGGGVIEADETFLGAAANTFVNRKGWTGGSGEKKILTVVERGGRARSTAMDSLRKEEIMRGMDVASRDSILATDEAQHYRRIGKDFLGHMTVQHGAGEYVRGEAHSNTVEGYFSIFKRGMRGVYQHCSIKHVQRYSDEFDFRYSNRVALGVDDTARATNALKGAAGKRLTYETISLRRPGYEHRIVW